MLDDITRRFVRAHVIIIDVKTRRQLAFVALLVTVMGGGACAEGSTVTELPPARSGDTPPGEDGGAKPSTTIPDEGPFFPEEDGGKPGSLEDGGTTLEPECTTALAKAKF